MVNKIRAVALVSLIALCGSLFAIHNNKNKVPNNPFIAYALENGNYEWAGDKLLLKRGNSFSWITSQGAEIPIGNFLRIDDFGGILFCVDDMEGKKSHYIINGNKSYILFDGANEDNLFYNDFPDNTSARASLFPQKDEASNKLGYLNRQNIWIIPPQYSLPTYMPYYQRESFINGIAFPQSETGSDLILYEDGKEDLLCVQGGYPSSEGFCCDRLKIEQRNYILVNGSYEKQSKYMFITKENSSLYTGILFDDAHDFSEGFSAVKKDGKWGYIDINGEIAVQFQFKVAGDFHNGIAAVSNEENELFFIDCRGEKISQVIVGYEFTGIEHDGLLLVTSRSGNTILLSKQGTVITNKQLYNYYWDTENDVWCAFVENNRNVECNAIILSNGTILYSEAPFRFYNSVCIGKTGEWDVMYSINSGDVLHKSLAIGKFSEGLATSRTSNKYGYIDCQGEWVIPPVFYGNSDLGNRAFHRGLAITQYMGSTVVIYNPILYKDGWNPNEYERSVSIGLANSAEITTNLVNKAGLYKLINSFIEVDKGICEKKCQSLHKLKNADDYLHGIAEESIITKEELSVVLYQMAQDMGEATEAYMGFFRNQNELCKQNEINYVASLGIFDIDNNWFPAQEAITYKEAAIIFLRFFEALS